MYTHSPFPKGEGECVWFAWRAPPLLTVEGAGGETSRLWWSDPEARRARYHGRRDDAGRERDGGAATGGADRGGAVAGGVQCGGARGDDGTAPDDRRARTGELRAGARRHGGAGGVGSLLLS